MLGRTGIAPVALGWRVSSYAHDERSRMPTCDDHSLRATESQKLMSVTVAYLFPMGICRGQRLALLKVITCKAV